MNCFIMFYWRFKKKIEKISDVSESLISLKSNEWCERIAHFAHQKSNQMSKFPALRNFALASVFILMAMTKN